MTTYALEHLRHIARENPMLSAAAFAAAAGIDSDALDRAVRAGWVRYARPGNAYACYIVASDWAADHMQSWTGRHDGLVADIQSGNAERRSEAEALMRDEAQWHEAFRLDPTIPGLGERWVVEFAAPSVSAAQALVRQATAHGDMPLSVSQSGRLGYEVSGGYADVEQIRTTACRAGTRTILTRSR